MIWTRERLATAAEHWTQGLSASEIAHRLGVSRNAVIGAIHRNRERFPPKISIEQRHIPAATPSKKSRRHFDFRNDRSRPAKAAPDAPVAPMLPDPPFDAGEPVRFIDVTDHECRWPLWSIDDNPGPYGLCCGATINFGEVYCRLHKRKAATPRMATEAGRPVR